MSKIIRCTCSSNEHIMIIDKDNDQTAYLSIHLSKKTFIQRLKYLFGYQCIYGAFEEIILDKENTKELYNMLKKWHE